MAEILLLGDEKTRSDGLRSLLRQDGHRVVPVGRIQGWRDREREIAPDLIVAAVPSAEPVLTIPARPARGFPAPILIVQHEGERYRDTHLEERIVDRLESPFMAEEFLARVDALIRVRKVVLHEESEDPQVAHARGGFGRRLAAALGTRVPRFERPAGPYLEVAARVADWSDARDAFEPGHAERVTSFSAMIADELGLADGETGALLRAAMLHDIGKVALPAEVLRMRGPLEEGQMRLLRTHADRGARILRALDRDETVATAVQYHHERVDGKGYHGMAGETIPLPSRILAVAEAYDAMTTTRVASPLSPEKAQVKLRDERGAQFDPQCVDALCRALKPAMHTIPLSTY